MKPPSIDESGTERIKLYHGTSWSNAQEILRKGFIESRDGLLGAGVYLAREAKARRFASTRSRHGGVEGGLVTVVVTYERAKFVGYDDRRWQAEGFDACRAEETSMSEHMEWCVKSRRQCDVLAVEKVNISDDGSPLEMLPPPTAEDETFEVTCLLLADEAVARRAKPEYPGEKLIGTAPMKGGETVLCREVHQQLFREVVFEGARIRFYCLADETGWIHDYDRWENAGRTLHVVSKSRVVVTMRKTHGEQGTELRSRPRYPGDSFRNGVKVRPGESVLADANVVCVPRGSPGAPCVTFYRLADGLGWLHDALSGGSAESGLVARPHDPEAEKQASARVADLDRERKVLAALVSGVEERRQTSLRLARQAEAWAAKRAEEKRRLEEEKRRLLEIGAKLWREAEEEEARRRRQAEEEAHLEARRTARGRLFYCNMLSESDYIETFMATEKVTSIATNGDATIALYENAGWAWTPRIPTQLRNKLKGRSRSRPMPTYVALGTLDRYYIEFADGKSQWNGADELTDELQQTSRTVRSVAFGSDYDSWFVVYDDGWWCSSWNIPAGLSKLLRSRNNSADLKCVSLGPNDEWYLEAETGRAWWGNVGADFSHNIRNIKNDITFLDFGTGDGYIVRYN
mmetsp:Transcript_28820/g.92812  ORF Transcript_28820/g.92812 Transcript_28820/m.92812 type:complete len:632 (+) Transcript_28820:57-1952(+)